MVINGKSLFQHFIHYMNNERGETNTTTNQTQQATPTSQETTLMNQQIANNQFMQPIAQKSYSDLSSNIQAILEGRSPAATGVGGITEGQTQSMVNASLRDIMPQFQASGILNSGEAAQIAGRTAMDTRNANAQFNVSAAQNLFNLASGGQSSLQSAYQNSTNNLTNELAGLRTISSNQTVTRNPFLESFYSSLGKGLGETGTNAVNSAIGSSSGGGNFAQLFAAG